MWTYTFAPCRGDKGLTFGPARSYFDRVIAAHLALGEVCTLTISEFKQKRSNRSNRALWGPIYDSVIEFLLSDQGYRRDEWAKMKPLLHEGLCGLYKGYDICPVTKKEIRKFRTSTANQSEMSEFMAWIAQYMAEEHGFVVQMPGENQ